MIRSAERDGVGSGASHLICGHTREHELLEQELAAFLGRERALLFSTGYMANLGTIAAATRRSLQLLVTEPWRRDILRAHISRFRAQARDIGLQLLPSQIPTQPLILGSAERALAAAAALESVGIGVSAIRPPTVPKDTARLRITLSAGHCTAEVDRLCDSLAGLQRQALI